MNTIPDLVFSACKKFNFKPAIEEDSKTFSFKDVYEQSMKISNFLIKNNLKKGDRVAICMNKSIFQVLSILGVSFSGGIFVPVLPNLKKDGINHILSHSGAKFIITDYKRYNEVKKTNYKCKVFFCCENVSSGTKYKNIWREITNYKKKMSHKLKILPNDDAAIIYSSGSTGYPKGIVIPHKNFKLGAEIVSDYLKTKKNDRIAGVLSFNFDYGLNQLWQCFYKGCTLVLKEIIFYQEFLKFCKSKKITAIPLMPVIISLITAGIKIKQSYALERVSYVCTSGGSVTKKMVINLKKLFPKARIVLMYGLTEAFRSTYLEPKKSLKKYYSIGKAIPKVKINILRENFSECKPGEIGELVHRGGCISSRYWNDKKSSLKRFRYISRFPGEVTVFSGDLVKKDKDGDIIFISRKDSMIKTMGYRVSPTEIEDQMLKHNLINQCVVFSKKDDEIGEKIFLSYTSTNKKKIKDEKLKSFLIKKLPKHMIPEKIYFFKKFKITGNQGKIDRKNVINLAIKKTN